MLFLALIYLAFISLGLPDSLLGSSWPLMSADFMVPVESAGYVSMLVSGGTIVSSLFSHRIIKRYGTGKITVISVAMTAAALLGFSLSPSFFWLLLCAIPLGLGAGAVDSGLNEFVAEHYEARHMSWLHCFWGIGTMLGPVLISGLAKQGHGFRDGYFCVFAIQLVLAALLLFSLPMWKNFEQLSGLPEGKAACPAAKQSFLAPLRAKGAIFAMLTFFLYCSAESSMMLWGASYLVAEKGAAPEHAAGWVSLFFLGITSGRMLSGFASMKLGSKALIRIGCILVISGLFLLLLPLSYPFSVFSFIIIGLGLAPIFPSMLHQTPFHFGKEASHAAMGMQMAFAYTGATLMPPLFGQLFAHTSFSLMPYVLFACALGLIICTELLPSKDKNPAS